MFPDREIFITFVKTILMVKYEVQFLEPAKVFLDKLDIKSREKIIFNIWKSRETNDPQLLKN